LDAKTAPQGVTIAREFTSPASFWINSITNKVFICADNTEGAAVWLPLN
jgi:hypothetical protein